MNNDQWKPWVKLVKNGFNVNLKGTEYWDARNIAALTVAQTIVESETKEYSPNALCYFHNLNCKYCRFSNKSSKSCTLMYNNKYTVSSAKKFYGEVYK